MHAVEMVTELGGNPRAGNLDGMLCDEQGTEQSLAMDVEPRLPSSMSGLENFKLGSRKEERVSPQSAKADAESLFNLAPVADDDEDEE